MEPSLRREPSEADRSGFCRPYGAYLANGSEYTGDYSLTRKELADFHAERLALLLEERPEIVAIETIPLLREAQAVLDVLKDNA